MATSKRIKRPAFAECRVNGLPTCGAIGKFGAQSAPRRKKACCQRAERLRQQSLEPLPQRFRQPRRCAPAADGDQDWITVDNRGQSEIAQRHPVDGVDQYPACFEAGHSSCGFRLILDRDDSQRGHAFFTDNHGARTIQQPPLGICRIAIANQDDIAPRQPDKERQAVHESGTDGCVQAGAAAVTAQAPITVEREGDEFGAPAKIFIGDRATKATVFERHATVR